MIGFFKGIIRLLRKMLPNERAIPLVVILGTTGTGKSKLALELASVFKGEIISADSMQVYKGLDIITNKVTREEQDLVPHHMLDFVDPLTEFTSVDFRNLALPKVRNILNQNKIPYIVGGTNYYIESLLWDILIPSAEDNSIGFIHEKEQKVAIPDLPIADIIHHPIIPRHLDHISSEELHHLLASIDPISADSLHPNNRRKIIRSLQIFQQHGQPQSTLIRNQKSQKGGNTLGGPLRFPKTVIFWLRAALDVLDKRLDQRVDQMIEAGLFEELLGFHQAYNKLRLSQNQTPDYTHGIFQSIGFKEFHPYLILPEEKRNSPEGQKLFKHCVEEMKRVTRRYARIQLKWINNRFLKRGDRDVPPIFALDVTNPEEWNEKVHTPAFEILSAIIEGKKPENDPLPIENIPAPAKTTFHCETCGGRTFVGENIWQIHLKSKKHKKMEAKKRKEQMFKKEDNDKVSQKEEVPSS